MTGGRLRAPRSAGIAISGAQAFFRHGQRGGAAAVRRQRRILEGSQGPVIQLQGQRVLNFCSNDYLGLASHPALAAAMKKGIDDYGVGSGASSLVCGYSRAHTELEQALAAFTRRPRALVFANGYMANQALISTWCGRGDTVFGDRLNHASLIDAARLSGAKLRRYRHAEPASLENLLDTTRTGMRLVCTDGVFSMDGDIAPLPPIASLCRRYDAMLLVDDAHGFGVLGNGLGGIVDYYGLDAEAVPALMATFGKALGVYGAFVAGDDALIDRLVQAARPYIYTTALPPALACAAFRALELIREEPWRAERLQSLIRYFRQGAGHLDLPLKDSATAIQPLVLGDAEAAVRASRALLERDIYIAAIRPPTVPQGTSRLRITLTAAHTEQHIDRLLDALAAVI